MILSFFCCSEPEKKNRHAICVRSLPANESDQNDNYAIYGEKPPEHFSACNGNRVCVRLDFDRAIQINRTIQSPLQKQI